MIALLASLVGPMMPLLIKVILGWIEKKEYNTELKKDFLKFIERVSDHRSTPVKLRRSYRDQLERHEKEISKL